ncbi:MAG TPA: SDR family NAD(P)-dependent oxidoreductase [Gemmatimonadaceae bacterium]|nr:SDR family NAD(P)-dependent oxidoreductase [Gemmatimonadaceae bacterium]
MDAPVAVVTGASRGIGRATALRLAPQFAIVALARNGDELASLAEEIESAGRICRPCVVDITNPAAVSDALDGIDAQVLVNNAGVGINKPFLDLTRSEWMRMVDLNLNALYDVTRAVLPAMIARRSGHIVFVGSITGRTAYAGGACYSATKHAVMGLSESLMLELREYGVKVSVVNPGSVATHFSERRDPSWMLAPEDVAEAIVRVVDTPADVLVHRMEVRTLTVPKRH